MDDDFTGPWQLWQVQPIDWLAAAFWWVMWMDKTFTEAAATIPAIENQNWDSEASWCCLPDKQTVSRSISLIYSRPGIVYSGSNFLLTQGQRLVRILFPSGMDTPSGEEESLLAAANSSNTKTFHTLTVEGTVIIADVSQLVLIKDCWHFITAADYIS